MTGCMLFVGDIHLGRRPVGLGDALAGLGLDAVRLSAARAWELTVDEAINCQARAVLLAGDVVEGEKDRIEGYGHLERGVRRLAEHGIPAFGVAGNHDALVLPRLADRLEDAFVLVGRGGTWECLPLPGDGPLVDLLGWSFPSSAYVDDPTTLESLQVALDSRRPEAQLIGLTHGDLDVGASRYAPLALRRLEASPVSAWFLGHIHVPGSLTRERPIGYLGSLTGLDAGEPGVRGPWAVEAEAGLVRATHVPLAPIRYENVEVELVDGPDIQDVDGVHGRIQAALHAHVLADPSFQDPRLQVIVARVRLTGRLAHRGGVRDLIQQHVPARGTLEAGGKPCILSRVFDATRPAIDLAQLAGQPTPAGAVARRIIELEAGEAEALVESARRRISPLTAGRWNPTGETGLLDPREALLAAARQALDVLLAQRDDGDAD